MKDGILMKKWFYRCLVAACIFSVTFLLMEPAVYIEGTIGDVSVVCLGLVFWLSLAAEIFCMIKTSAIFNRNAKGSQNAGKVRPLRPFKFFSNTIAIVSDIVLILSAAAAVVFAIIKPETVYAYFIVVFAITLSIPMHLLFNSNIYSFIEYIKETRGKK